MTSNEREVLKQWASWTPPAEGTVPAPRFVSASGRAPRAGEPLELRCDAACPWYMAPRVLTARALLAGATDGWKCIDRQLGHCMHPGREHPETEDYGAWCWPAHALLWERAMAAEHDQEAP